MLISLLVVRHSTAQSHGELRLVMGDNFTDTSLTGGRLEIFINGEWGTICDDNFDHTDANVACRQLGFKGAVRFATAFHSVHEQGESESPIWLDDVGCTDENLLHLLSCSNAGIGVHDCDHFSDIAVECDPLRLTDHPISSQMVRLTDGVYHSEGQVEVYCNGEWSAACVHESLDVIDAADFICNQLGYTEASDVEFANKRTANFESVTCLSSANTISFCDSPCRLDSEQSCAMNTTLRVKCNHTITYGTLRLVGGLSSDPNITDGRLDIFINGQWGTVCGELFEQIDADVSCRELGFERAYMFGPSGYLGYEAGTGSIWLAGVQCHDYHNTLVSCPSNMTANLTCLHQNDIALICTMEPLPNTTVAVNSKLFELFPFSLEIFIIIVVGGSLVLCMCCLCLIAICTHICCGYSSTSKMKNTQQSKWLSLYESPDGMGLKNIELDKYEIVFSNSDLKLQTMSTNTTIFSEFDDKDSQATHTKEYHLKSLI